MFVLPELLELVLLVRIWLLSSVCQDYPSYQTDIDAIEYNNMCNLREQIFQMFHEWKRKEGSGATTARESLFGGMERWNGMVEWNGGIE